MKRVLPLAIALAALPIAANGAKAATPEQYLAQCRAQFETFAKYQMEDDAALAQHFQFLTTAEPNVSNAADNARQAQAWGNASADIRANGVNAHQITTLWNNPSWFAGLDTVQKVQEEITGWQQLGADPRQDRYHQAPPMLCTLQIRLAELQAPPAATAPEPQFGGGAVVGRTKAASEPQFGGGAVVGGSKSAAASEPQFGGGAVLGSTKAASEPQFGGGAVVGGSKSAAASEPQFGGGASLEASKEVTADNRSASQCVVARPSGGKGNYSRLENICAFAVNVRFCNDGAKPGSFEAGMACGGGAVWGGTADIAAHTRGDDNVGARVRWTACRSPAQVTAAQFTPGKGITAQCR